MTRTAALVATENGAKYMKQLCRHWAHKFPVTFDEERGRIELPTAVCTMHVLAGGLRVELAVAEDGDVERMEGVLEKHVARFAFQEELTFPWQKIESSVV